MVYRIGSLINRLISLRNLRALSTVLLLSCLNLPIAKCSMGGNVDSSIDTSPIPTLESGEDDSRNFEQEIQTGEVNLSTDSYFYIFALSGFDPFDIESYFLPAGFTWPLLILLLRMYRNNIMINIIELALCCLTSYILMVFVVGFHQLIGWYIGVFGTILMWVVVISELVKKYRFWKQSRPS